jgi:hypothetical protein
MPARMMKQREWMGYAAAVLAAGAFLTGCGNIRKLAKSDPELKKNFEISSKQEFLLLMILKSFCLVLIHLQEILNETQDHEEALLPWEDPLLKQSHELLSPLWWYKHLAHRPAFPENY